MRVVPRWVAVLAVLAIATVVCAFTVRHAMAPATFVLQLSPTAVPADGFTSTELRISPSNGRQLRGLQVTVEDPHRAAVESVTVEGDTATADTLHRLSLERPKKDMDREPAFQERNWSRIRESLERMEKTYDPRLDQALFRHALVEAVTLPADQRIAPLDAAIGLTAGRPAADAAKAIDAWLGAVYPKATLGDKAVRLALFTKPAAEIVASPDPFVKLAIALHPLHEAVREKEKSDAGKRSLLRPRYMRALLAKEGGLVAPDANSTLRVTYGTVKGVSPRDGMAYLPQTTLQGILEKQTGTGEFDAPKVELDAIQALRNGKRSPYVDPKLKDVPVDYLSDVDTTGGNSGSATLNSKNQLVGLLFDGTFDTVASDFLFDREKTRSMHVDSRYLLWVMTEVDGATNVLEEMKLD